ncbi:biotin carboxylase N-terminal domain-containing protein [Microbacterium sp.]|uniref:acetyl/propionyl/methylcrotonyl-CoA carboxylase subunit alpha n=1 Tax=Microbacterium sp. TaxID=51671 RepID=UPI00262984B1|nr:biotin carboxylase N-terminal domain-containing protein [Microbacterium sp.]MCV0335783.1 ATP-grasp domain-containing protein [Microbacterium sp.]MCV0377244.1 ATP-grasp domain-containing protein [Microbacterium sp.]MCV0391586.1 ATP-grasp domain-containing protein [Microbacterium sp.]MCV0419913.1 ATP-grasp domain-containing protein [Microbacterium sp.]MCV0423637.1 ATP-grasp domain-containing protein [Microbacterium sp.]
MTTVSTEPTTQRVLIANRGEIAVRVVRACAEAGYTSVAVYADQDADALHVRLADEAVGLGAATGADTYLSIEALLAAARRADATAVHPGYGFLSESAAFARAVEDAGLVWIGPSPESIDALGDKMTARRIAQRVGAPLAAGTDQPLAGPEEAVAFAEEHGLPIAIKAAFGGGGRGLKVVRELSEVAAAFDAATREAIAAFGRGECFVERFLESPRHIEVQVLGDGRGGVVVVGDRDCSMQRRNQKLIEEAPAPGLSVEQRTRFHDAARSICGEVEYRGAGTVEFLLAADGTISFLEVNTRLQVEHPVTEEVTGTDLVREQFRIAFGEGPSFVETPAPIGHAFEFRINAEDPGRGFLPSPGRVERLRIPGGPGVRWDSGIEEGDVVHPAFDSMIAKLIVHAESRDAAIVRARRALRELTVEGPATVIPFDVMALDEEAFGTATFAVHTQWIESSLLPKLETQSRPAAVPDSALQRFPVEIDGRRVMLGLPAGLLSGLGRPAAPAPAAPTSDPTELRAPVPGTLVRWLVDDGTEVAEGEPVAVLDAMKMETTVTAHRSGSLSQRVELSAMVAADGVLAVID